MDSSSPNNHHYLPSEAFFQSNLPFGLTYDDVSLATNFSNILPAETDLTTRLSESITLPVPIISADMDTVTESDMAIAMALNGGLGLIHYNLDPEIQIKEVTRVKNYINGLIRDPISVSPEQSIGDVLAMVEAKSYSFRTFPVVDEKNHFLGLLRGRIVKSRYAAKTVYETMTPAQQVLTIQEKAIGDNPIATADKIFTENSGIHKLLVLDEQQKLKGLFTLSDIERIIEESRTRHKATRDPLFRLRCGVAVSVSRNGEGKLDHNKLIEHVGQLIDKDVDVIAVSTAHGHSEGVGQAIRLLRQTFPAVTLMAGNVTSAEGVEYLAQAGANAIKVGQGPGSICTTRIIAGVGIPQMTALYFASDVAAKYGVSIIADGGISKSGDIVKALTLANVVICGSLLAGCNEAPGEMIEIDGKPYKKYRGMGSLAAMRKGSAVRYGHKSVEGLSKVAAEGIEALKESAGSVDKVLNQLIGGIQSGMGYLGASNLKELKSKARFIRVTYAGQREAAPHDIIEIKTT